MRSLLPVQQTFPNSGVTGRALPVSPPVYRQVRTGTLSRAGSLDVNHDPRGTPASGAGFRREGMELPRFRGQFARSPGNDT